ncbi:MAG: 50S ribosomal protein L24 [Candidatus Andersenbacteria bacterium]|nr:50S ribosomal protein L24 [Candidatus Andersenbacteria bacterium]
MVIRRGDIVKVLLGRDRGKTGKVLSVLPREGRVLVEGVNIVHRHIRPRKSGERGQRVSLSAPLAQARVQLVCPSCKRATRARVQMDAGGRQRVCRKCSAVIAR